MTCHVLALSGLFGKKWTLALLEQVSLHGNEGFNSLSRRMGKVSPKILSQRLHQLEAHEIVQRTVQLAGNQTRTSYTMTKKGEDLLVIFGQLKRWNTSYPECAVQSCADCPRY
ncbi:MAG: helix-turn-helix transcriptional regulator [Candidatus Aenigmarchaeota archaeon]|nr:helix-turn-helix transcriptional regulator [Candidatus Aenigmarchaeota archaeon]